jgi:hypothetical protein
MGAFDSKPLSTTPLNTTLRRNPLLFGASFVMIMVVASYALVPFVQTKYELQDRRISKVRPKPCVLAPEFLREIFRSRRNRNSAWKIGRESLTSARNTLQVSPTLSPRSLRFTFRLLLETQCEGRRRLGTQTHRTSSRNSRMGSTTA